MANSVKVKFQNDKHNYITDVNPDCSEKELRAYFVDQWFNVGAYPKEIMRKCIDIELHG